MKMIAFGTLRFDRRSIPPDLTDIGQWPGADDSALSDEGRDLLTRRIRAMTLFVDGHTPLREITRETGVGFNDLYRVFERCIMQHDDGRIFGCRALRFGAPFRNGMLAVSRQPLGERAIYGVTRRLSSSWLLLARITSRATANYIRGSS